MGGGLLTALPFSGPAAPFVAIAAGITEVGGAIMNLIGVGKGCGPTCVQTSQWANQAETLLQQNLNAYFAQPAPRSAASQQAAMANFTAVWNQLMQICSQPGLGTAGQHCVSDRQQGACTIRQTQAGYNSTVAQNVPSSLVVPPGQCWNWFAGYFNPIQNDPYVGAAAPAGTSQGAGPNTIFNPLSTVAAISSTGISPILLIGGAAAAALLLMGMAS